MSCGRGRTTLSRERVRGNSATLTVHFLNGDPFGRILLDEILVEKDAPEHHCGASLSKRALNAELSGGIKKQETGDRDLCKNCFCKLWMNRETKTKGGWLTHGRVEKGGLGVH